jgi:hypothetical protein
MQYIHVQVVDDKLVAPGPGRTMHVEHIVKQIRLVSMMVTSSLIESRDSYVTMGSASCTAEEATLQAEMAAAQGFRTS